MSSTRPAVVFCGGDPPLTSELAAVPGEACVIAVDHGVDHARQAGVVPHLVIGDMDSASPAALEWADAAGARIDRHPAAKDQTDFELALAAAAAAGPRVLHVVAIAGGRLDHLLGNLAVLADPEWATLEITASGGGNRITVIPPRSQRRIAGEPHGILSLVPVGDDVTKVTTTGLVYPLSGETLRTHDGRGLSNRFVGDEATVSVESGTLLAIQPEYFS